MRSAAASGQLGWAQAVLALLLLAAAAAAHAFPGDAEVRARAVDGRTEKVFYVDARTGNDTNTGVTPETAWKTLSYAMDHSVDFTTLVLYPGEYGVHNLGVPNHLALRASNVSAAGAGGDAPIIHGPDNVKKNVFSACLVAMGSINITGIVFDSCYEALNLESQSTRADVRIVDSVFRYNKYVCLGSRLSRDVVVIGTLFEFNGQSSDGENQVAMPLVRLSADTITFFECRFSSNVHRSLALVDMEMTKPVVGHTVMQYTEFVNNTVVKHNGHVAQASVLFAAAFAALSDVVVSDNNFYDNFGTAVHFSCAGSELPANRSLCSVLWTRDMVFSNTAYGAPVLFVRPGSSVTSAIGLGMTMEHMLFRSNVALTAGNSGMDNMMSGAITLATALSYGFFLNNCTFESNLADASSGSALHLYLLEEIVLEISASSFTSDNVDRAYELGAQLQPMVLLSSFGEPKFNGVTFHSTFAELVSIANNGGPQFTQCTFTRAAAAWRSVQGNTVVIGITDAATPTFLQSHFNFSLGPDCSGFTATVATRPTISNSTIYASSSSNNHQSVIFYTADTVAVSVLHSLITGAPEEDGSPSQLSVLRMQEIGVTDSVFVFTAVQFTGHFGSGVFSIDVASASVSVSACIFENVSTGGALVPMIKVVSPIETAPQATLTVDTCLFRENKAIAIGVSGGGRVYVGESRFYNNTVQGTVRNATAAASAMVVEGGEIQVYGTSACANDDDHEARYLVSCLGEHSIISGSLFVNPDRVSGCSLDALGRPFKLEADDDRPVFFHATMCPDTVVALEVDLPRDSVSMSLDTSCLETEAHPSCNDTVLSTLVENETSHQKWDVRGVANSALSIDYTQKGFSRGDTYVLLLTSTEQAQTVSTLFFTFASVYLPRSALTWRAFFSFIEHSFAFTDQDLHLSLSFKNEYGDAAALSRDATATLQIVYDDTVVESHNDTATIKDGVAWTVQPSHAGTAHFLVTIDEKNPSTITPDNLQVDMLKLRIVPRYILFIFFPLAIIALIAILFFVIRFFLARRARVYIKSIEELKLDLMDKAGLDKWPANVGEDIDETIVKNATGVPEFDFAEIASGLKPEALVGTGGFGEVFALRYKGQVVAVKRIYVETANDSDVQKAFVEEVTMMHQARHPSIVHVHAACVTPPNLCFIAEYVPGGTLFNLLHERHDIELSMGDRLHILAQIASAMSYLHHEHKPSIVHRDLKSLNLLMYGAGLQVKLTDFGLARNLVGTFLSTVQAAGSPAWMSPEQLNGDRARDKVDVYSFGVLMWEIATRQVPWAGCSFADVVREVGVLGKSLDVHRAHDAWRELENAAADYATSVASGVEDDNGPLLDRYGSGGGVAVNYNHASRFSNLLAGCLLKNAKKRPSFKYIAEQIADMLSNCAIPPRLVDPDGVFATHSSLFATMESMPPSDDEALVPATDGPVTTTIV